MQAAHREASFVGALALLVAAAIAVLGSLSASPDAPANPPAAVRVGVFDRARIPSADADLEQLFADRSFADVGRAEHVVFIVAKPERPTWSDVGVELVDVTAALAARLSHEVQK